MFIIRKTRAGMAYAYRMLLSLKTSVTYIKNFTTRRATVSLMTQLLSDITRFFPGHFPMSGANMQASLRKTWPLSYAQKNF